MFPKVELVLRDRRVRSLCLSKSDESLDVQVDTNLTRMIPRNGCLVKDHRPRANIQDET
jgi:hypothetical protein